MPFSKCRDVIEKVSAVLEKEATFIERMRFHMHLMMCSNCRRYYKQFKEVSQHAGVVEPEDLPTDFAHVMDFVLNETAHDCSKHEGKSPPSAIPDTTSSG